MNSGNVKSSGKLPKISGLVSSILVSNSGTSETFLFLYIDYVTAKPFLISDANDQSMINSLQLLIMYSINNY